MSWYIVYFVLCTVWLAFLMVDEKKYKQVVTFGAILWCMLIAYFPGINVFSFCLFISESFKYGYLNKFLNKKAF